MRISDWSSDVCSSDLDGKVDRIYVEENQHVKAGDVLFRIDPAPYEVAVHEAEAALLQARAQVEALKATYAQKQAALRSTQADLTFRQSDYKRVKALQAVGASPKSALAEAKRSEERRVGQEGVSTCRSRW